MTVNTHTAIEKSITDYSQKVQEPTWMLQRRLNASAKVETLALPHVEKTKIDNWNFTNFTPFASAQSISAENLPAALAELISENDENLYVQINSDEIVHRFSDKLKNQGVIFTSLQTALVEHPDLVEKYFMKAIDENDNRLNALHTALWNNGLFLYVPKNVVIEEPILALFGIQGDRVGLIPHILVVVEDNSELTFVENRVSVDNGADQVHNGITEIFVGPNAKVNYAAVYAFSEYVTDYTRRVANVYRDGRIEWAIGETGDSNSVSENLANLIEDGGSSDTKVISIGSHQQKGNFTSRTIHHGKATESEMLSKGVLLEGASLVFNGITKIEKGATKANGEQTERLLILSPQARGDANPILLIDEDDVKCGHAASVGRIDEIQLYYLMARGISRKEAERMIIRGFLDPVVSEIKVELVKTRLKEAIERKLNR